MVIDSAVRRSKGGLSALRRSERRRESPAKRAWPGVIRLLPNYFRRRRIKAATPRPSAAIVAGSGTIWTEYDTELLRFSGVFIPDL